MESEAEAEAEAEKASRNPSAREQCSAMGWEERYSEREKILGNIVDLEGINGGGRLARLLLLRLVV